MTLKMATDTASNYQRQIAKLATTTIKNSKVNRLYQIPKLPFDAYLRNCWQALNTSFTSLSNNPFATLLTLTVIAIALALPAGLIVMLQNIESITHGWHKGASISLYLKPQTSPAVAAQLSQQLKLEKKIGHIQYISPNDGLQQLAQFTGFRDVLSELTQNPLPTVIMVQPAASIKSPLEIHQLLSSLKQLPQVASAELDMQWVKRLYAFIELGQRIVYGLAILLAIAVILIIGNTIRLITENKREEILLMSLLGATDRFIRRPFLYTGVIYGTLGGIIAMLLVDSFLSWLALPMMQLSDLYDSTFRLSGLTNGQTIWLLISGAILGIIGAWLAVAKHLRHFSPH